MFELTVEGEFCAAHAIVINGTREPVHGHNWRVEVTVAADELDDNGLVCDFHKLENVLHNIIAPLNNNDLNATSAFKNVNPTAENVVRHIAREFEPHLPWNVRFVKATVTEAPGCRATYRP